MTFSRSSGWTTLAKASCVVSSRLRRMMRSSSSEARHLAGYRIGTPGPHMGHGLGLGQVVLALRQGLFGYLLLGDIHQHGQALFPGFGDHRLDPDILRLLSAGGEPQPAGLFHMAGKDRLQEPAEDEPLLIGNELLEAPVDQDGPFHPQQTDPEQVDRLDHPFPVEGEIPYRGKVVEKGVLVARCLQLVLGPAQFFDLRLQLYLVDLKFVQKFQGRHL